MSLSISYIDYHRLMVCIFLFLSVLRDISERGRELEQVLNQYITFVKPAFEEFCLPVSIFVNVFLNPSLTALYCQDRYHLY